MLAEGCQSNIYVVPPVIPVVKIGAVSAPCLMAKGRKPIDTLIDAHVWLRSKARGPRKSAPHLVLRSERVIDAKISKRLAG
jgi:hypothetical protein